MSIAPKRSEVKLHRAHRLLVLRASRICLYHIVPVHRGVVFFQQHLGDYNLKREF
jgi:hypothetical protein